MNYPFGPASLCLAWNPGMEAWKILISFVGMKKMLAKHFISALAFVHQIEYLIAKDLNGGKLAVCKEPLFSFFLRTF